MQTAPRNFAAVFAAQEAPAPTTAINTDRPKAEYWLNFGYVSDAIDETTGEKVFVAMPMGIALDTQTMLATNKGSDTTKALNHARNQFTSELMESIKSLDLKPNQSKILPLAGDLGLAVQIRRVKDEIPFDTAAENPFLRKLGVL